MVETSLKYATVVGRFVSVTGDSPDDDDNNPDIVPLQGTVTFTPRAKHALASNTPAACCVKVE